MGMPDSPYSSRALALKDTSKSLKGRCDVQVTCSTRKPFESKAAPGKPCLTQVPLIQGRVRPWCHFLLPTPPDCPTSSSAEHRPGTVCGHGEGHCLADEQVQLRDFCLHLQAGSLAGSTPATRLFFTGQHPRQRCTNKPCESLLHL